MRGIAVEGGRVVGVDHESGRIAAGAVVTEGTQVPPGSLVVGVPGKVVRALSAEQITGLGTALVRALPKAPGIVVRVADDVPVEGAAAALQGCRDAGFERIAYQPGARSGAGQAGK